MFNKYISRIVKKKKSERKKKDKLKIDGSLRWNHNNGDVYSKQTTESFVSTVGAFSNSTNQTYSSGNSFNGQAKIECLKKIFGYVLVCLMTNI